MINACAPLMMVGYFKQSAIKGVTVGSGDAHAVHVDESPAGLSCQVVLLDMWAGVTASECIHLMQDFLNGVCTHIIWLTEKKLTYYTGMQKVLICCSLGRTQ